MKTIRRAIYIFVCILPPVLFCMCSGRLMLPLAIAVFVHELAHLAALWVFGGKLRSFKPAPFGLCMEFDESSLSLLGEGIVSIAGCVANVLSAALSIAIDKLFSIDTSAFFTVSLLLAMLNSIPTEPLDGGRLLKIIITARYGPFVACRVMAVVTYMFGFAIFLLASYMLLVSASGIYPLLFSIYIFAGNAKTLEKVFLEEN